ncbi:MAG: hypothetical protein ACTHM0_13050 [Sphingomonas sp.]
MDPATRAHTAVAYQNLLPIISALYQHNRSKGAETSIEQFLSDLGDSLESTNDEIAQRRLSWFMFAGLIARLEKLARSDEEVIPVAATIWTIIATEYPRLKTLLPHNVVWKHDEKEWFELNISDRELIQTAVNHHIPPRFATHEIVKRFARDLDLFYYPSKTRIGYIP